jgi:hypothetical protein
VTSERMKNLERQIGSLWQKLHNCIWSSHSQFGTWKKLNYSLEEKGEPWNFCQRSRDIFFWAKWLIAKIPARKKIRKISTNRILYVPNIYLIIFHLIHTLSFFYKVKTVNVLQCCNGRYRSVSKNVKMSISFCHVCPQETSRILGVLSWNLRFKYFSKICIEN